MTTIAGLGNPGEEYEGTRHNAGADAVRAARESFAFPPFVSSSKYSGDISEGMLDGNEIRFFVPSTFMNASGTAVRRATEHPGDLILVTDDIDLPIGTFKISYESGSGGHNGVRSVVDAFGTNAFARVRIGIAPVSFFGTMRKPARDRVADFVLKRFTPREMKTLASLMPKIADAFRMIVTDGRTAAMNTYN